MKSSLNENGAWGRIRTTDTRIFNPLLYQLSYPGAPSGGVYRRGVMGCPALARKSLDLFVILIASRLAGDGVVALHPPRQVDVGASLRAERPVVWVSGFVADRTGGHRAST